MNAIMSGSGPTVFGLFADRARAEKAKKFLARALRRSVPDKVLSGQVRLNRRKSGYTSSITSWRESIV